MTAFDTGDRRAAFTADLIGQGWLRTAAWREAFRAVPRDAFLPRFFRQTADGQHHEAIDRQHPEWLDLVYRNSVLATQLDSDDRRWYEAREHGPLDGVVTSSSTQPSLMAVMLEALDVQDGQRVLEVGTGTGYNAALLSHRLGEHLVTSIEYDQGVAADAAQALTAARYHPTLVVGDGAAGYPPNAPYERLIATYSVGTIPPAWLAQVRPGGVIITSLYRELGVGLLLRLVVDADGSAHGRLLDDSAYFMPTRLHATTKVTQLVRAASAQTGETRTTALPEPVTDEPSGWTALAGLVLPGVARLDVFRDDGMVQWLVHTDGSWAYYETAGHRVEQGGPRHLWNQLEAIHRQWQTHGMPGRDRLGLTVTADGMQRIWIDKPECPVADVASSATNDH